MQKITASLNPIHVPLYNAPVQVIQENDKIEIISSSDVEANYLALETQADFEEKKHFAEKQLKSQLKHTQRSIINFSNELETALGWENLQHEATLLQSNLFK